MAKKCFECSGAMDLVRGTRKGVDYAAYRCVKCGEEIMSLDQAANYLDAAQSAKTVSLSKWGKSLGLRIPASIVRKFRLSDKKKARITEEKGSFKVTPLSA